MEKTKKDLRAMKRILYDMGPLMASPESFKGLTHHSDPLQTIAAYLLVHLGRLDKLQGKAVTHFCEVEWWRTLMVECVTVF